MNNLFLTPRAEEDLKEIFEYSFFRWGLLQAEKYQDDLYDGFNVILQNKEIGKIYLNGKRSYRKLHINRHLIFYRTYSTKFLMVRILHDRMEIKKHFNTE